MRSFLLLASLIAYAAATGRPLGNRLAELVHQDPLNEEKIDKMLSLIDDAEEMNLLFSGMANMITTRSDVFTVYMTIRTFKQDPVTGIWDASKDENIIDQSRYVMIVDRSKVDSPTEKPDIRAFSKVE